MAAKDENYRNTMKKELEKNIINLNHWRIYLVTIWPSMEKRFKILRGTK